MSRDVRLYLQDILDSIHAIKDYTGPITKQQFHENRQVQDAVLRRLEVIGEAVKNLNEAFRSEYDQIPWKKIAGLRDILIHEYFGVKLERVWVVVRRDLPDLESKISQIWNEIEDS